MEDRPAEDTIKWNPPSNKHSNKMKALLTDLSKEEVGKINFSRNAEYIISPRGRQTVYLGFSEELTKVAIREIEAGTMDQYFDNVKNLLQVVREQLESKNLMKYVGLEKDKYVYYLAAELCECDLVAYVNELKTTKAKAEMDIAKSKTVMDAAKKAKAVKDIAKAKAVMDATKAKAVKDAAKAKAVMDAAKTAKAVMDAAKAKAVTDILRGLQALHTVEKIHGALKPSRIFIDSHNTAKLADYDIIYKLKRSSTADTQSWEATEILNKTEKSHTKSSDIQVAGMLVYYILSDGKHPFGDIKDCRENIMNGKYSLEHVEDIVAKDLIEWMINKEPKNRPTIDEVLQHPYFWDNNRKDLILRRLGDREEVQNYRKYYAELRPVVAKFTTDKISDWKSKMRSWGREESKSIWGRIDPNLPEDFLGLLRFLRNKLVHESGSFTRNFHDNLVMNTVRDVFPEFFICLHRLAYELKWEY